MLRPATGIHKEHYVYVDNLGCLCSDEGSANEAVSKWVEAFEAEDLKLHKAEVTRGEVVLGSTIDGTRLRMEITQERLSRLQAAVRGLLARRRVAGWCVETVLGHLTFCGLANRALLSTLHTPSPLARQH